MLPPRLLTALFKVVVSNIFRLWCGMPVAPLSKSNKQLRQWWRLDTMLPLEPLHNFEVVVVIFRGGEPKGSFVIPARLPVVRHDRMTPPRSNKHYGNGGV
jgi:hypothetical protein